METGSISSWYINEGDAFREGDAICSVETDKASVDYVSQDEGVLAKILAPAGNDADIPIGIPIMITVENINDVAAFATYEISSPSNPSSIPSTSTTSIPPPPSIPSPVSSSSSSSPPAVLTPTTTTTTTIPTIPTGDRVFASPLARKLAKENGYTLSQILGTGPNGRIVAADVKEYQPTAAATAVAAAAAAADTTTSPLSATATTATSPSVPTFNIFDSNMSPMVGHGYIDYPLSEASRVVAAQLTHAKQNVPHYYLTVDISMDAILALRTQLNDASSSSSSSGVGVYELMIKAAAKSMSVIPAANASWMDSVVRVYESVDINVVMGSGDTMYTPVIKNCANIGVNAISKELRNALLILEEQENESPSLPKVEYGIGTFTIFNVGMYGVKSCAMIIREPQACALALGAIENRIVPNTDDNNKKSEDDIYKESMILTATLSCDHRVVDGAVGAQWLAAFKSYVEHPMTLLL
jgi:pyruvate dehydrogenase E2 component (dihydrolipoamide acetyltransferase)